LLPLLLFSSAGLSQPLAAHGCLADRRIPSPQPCSHPHPGTDRDDRQRYPPQHAHDAENSAKSTPPQLTPWRPDLQSHPSSRVSRFASVTFSPPPANNASGRASFSHDNETMHLDRSPRGARGHGRCARGTRSTFHADVGGRAAVETCNVVG